MKKAMTKKFIAAVMAFAMLLGTVQVFAAPVVLPDGRNPALTVSLRVHHTQGQLSTPVSGPGEWLPPAAPTGTRPPVQGSIWRAARIEGPALFPTEVLVAPGPDAANPIPGSADGVTTLPAVVRNAIVNGWIGANLAAAGETPRFPVLAASGGAPLVYPASPVAPATNTWYITSGGDAPAITGNGTNAAAVPGAHQASTPFFGAGAAPADAGIAHFTADMINNALPAGDTGQGLWLVWEVNVGVWDVPGTAPGGPTDNFDIIPPFLVNLPTYRHTPDTNGDTGWLYNVHVFPKGARDQDLDKEAIGPPVIGSTTHPTTNFSVEYTILRWRVSFDFDSEMEAGLLPQPIAGTSPTEYTAGFPVPPANIPANGAMPAPVVPTYILVTDELDPRLRLLESNYGGATVPAHMAANYWLTVHVGPDDDFTNAAAFPRMANATDANWIIVTHPNPLVTRPQTFYIHFTATGIENLQAAQTAGGSVFVDFRTIAEDLTTWPELDTIYNDVTLNFGNRPGVNLNPGDPHPDRRPPVDLHALIVNKINPSGAQLDGAVFFLYTFDQVTLTAGEWVVNESAPGVRVLPHRVAISGGLAGNNAAIIFPNNPALSSAEEDLIESQAALAIAGQGEAIFMALPPTNLSSDPPIRYFLYEAVAPLGNDGSQYRRITSIVEVTVAGDICLVAAHHVPNANDGCADCHYAGHTTPADCVADPEDCYSNCILAYRTEIEFSNTRDFYLPMTGGAGTILFTTAGVSLMGIAGLFLFLARKKDKNTKVVRTIQ